MSCELRTHDQRLSCEAAQLKTGREADGSPVHVCLISLSNQSGRAKALIIALASLGPWAELRPVECANPINHNFPVLRWMTALSNFPVTWNLGPGLRGIKSKNGIY